METLGRKARLSGESPRFQPTVITDEDIGWACRVLKLPATAFSGSDGKDPRMEVLKSTATLDIEACPGSGKTTLLVAKLAILSRRWSNPRRGLCVLSHTNVARREIEQRLGNNATGQRLLSYPHFVGTIHSFVIEFLSMPWLRSLGYPVRVIDNDLCEQHRRRLLRLSQFSALARYVTARESNGKVNVVSNWRVATPAFDIRKGESGEPEFNDATKPASRQLCALAKKCVTDGYHRYDEMFMWGHDLLDNLPDVCEVVRKRFPMLFIDEVQDNSEEQSFLLFRLFTKGDNAVFRQRFGDANQAIYQHAGLTSGATTDQFPDSCIRREIPNSHRFSQEIANLANPLALKPQNLIGCGPFATALHPRRSASTQFSFFQIVRFEMLSGPMLITFRSCFLNRSFEKARLPRWAVFTDQETTTNCHGLWASTGRTTTMN
jgi:DNA helicase-2/ATP-dependent DNA helicase PcrA